MSSSGKSNAYNYMPMQAGASATGSGTSIDVLGYGTLSLQVSGTFTATVSWEGTIDGTNWDAIGVVSYADKSTVAVTATTAGLHYVDVSGLTKVRGRVSTYTAGTVTVTGCVTT